MASRFPSNHPSSNQPAVPEGRSEWSSTSTAALTAKSRSTSPSPSVRNQAAPDFGRSSEPGSLRARGRRGEALASARDRQRLREREIAERGRVEGMFASAPLFVDRRTNLRVSDGGYSAPRLRMLESAACPICGDGRIVSDEVNHAGRLRVSECLHCDHRWTQRLQGRWAELGARMSGGVRPRAIPNIRSA